MEKHISVYQKKIYDFALIHYRLRTINRCKKQMTNSSIFNCLFKCLWAESFMFVLTTGMQQK